MTATSIQLFYSFYHVGLRCVNLIIQIYDDEKKAIAGRYSRQQLQELDAQLSALHQRNNIVTPICSSATFITFITPRRVSIVTMTSLNCFHGIMHGRKNLLFTAQRRTAAAAAAGLYVVKKASHSNNSIKRSGH